MPAHARVAKIAIDEAQRAQERNLEKPVQDDRYPSQEEGAGPRRDKNIIQHHERERQYRRHPHNVQRVGQRNKSPLRGGQAEDVTNHGANQQEIGHDAQQQRQAVVEGLSVFEAKVERSEQRTSRREHIMGGDQVVA